jgi:hypothetical protein
MKARTPSKAAHSQSNDEKLKIVIRIRPVLNEEDPAMFVSLEDVRKDIFQNDTL